MKYILCELDDESYAHPSFSFHQSFDTAQNSAIESIVKNFEYSDGYNFSVTSEETEIKTEGGVRISANWTVDNGMNQSDCFYVTEFFPIDESKGTHLLIWHHAYEGVGFKIEKQGTYEECLAERKRQVKSLYEDCESGNWRGDNTDFDPDKTDIIDTGNEWEMWSIVEIK